MFRSLEQRASLAMRYQRSHYESSDEESDSWDGSRGNWIESKENAAARKRLIETTTSLIASAVGLCKR